MNNEKHTLNNLTIFWNLKKTLLLLFTGIITINSCEPQNWNCIEGNGNVKTEQRETGGFNEIKAFGSFIVNVFTDSEFSIEITGDDNILKIIKTRVSDNILIIELENNNCYSVNNEILMNIRMPLVKNIELLGSGSVFCNNITGDRFSAKVLGSGIIKCSGVNVENISAVQTGSGIIDFRGVALNSEFINSGSGKVKSFELTQENCNAILTGSGNIYAKVISELEVTLTGSGDFYYIGNPEIELIKTGTGKLIKY